MENYYNDFMGYDDVYDRGHTTNNDAGKELIGKVIIMKLGDKGPVFKKRGLPVMFVSRKCNIDPGPVFVEDVVLKGRFGFIIGKNVKLKINAIEKDYFTLIGKGYKNFGTYNIGDDKALMVCLGLIKSAFIDENNDVLNTLENYDDIDHQYNRFVTKYFLDKRDFGVRNTNTTFTDNIFSRVYFYGILDSFEYFKNDARFNISRVNIDNLIGKSPEEIEKILVENRNKNIKKLNDMLNIHMNNITKNISSSFYPALGRLSAIIKDYLNTV